MTRYGLISDIHSNLNSLESAIKLLSNNRVDKTFHLGDVVYGHEFPDEVVSLLIQNGIFGVKGDHDESELKYSDKPLNEKTRKYLSKLEKSIELEDGSLLIHDNPLNAEFGKGYWHLGSYIRNAEDAKRVFEDSNQRILIVGHTHIPCLLSDKGEEIFFPEGGKIILKADYRYILNPGSVGAPRDYKKPGFGIYDTEENSFEVIRF
jgi:predicted phosphodiesterase